MCIVSDFLLKTFIYVYIERDTHTHTFVFELVRMEGGKSLQPLSPFDIHKVLKVSWGLSSDKFASL